MTQMNLFQMHMDVGEVEFENGHPVLDEAVIYFPALFDSPEIRVKSPRAHELAEHLVKLWNDAARISNSDSPIDGSYLGVP